MRMIKEKEIYQNALFIISTSIYIAMSNSGTLRRSDDFNFISIDPALVDEVVLDDNVSLRFLPRVQSSLLAGRYFLYFP